MTVSTTKVAIVGIGNCAAALVQALWYYRDTDRATAGDGLITPIAGGYGIDSIEVVAAFDVHQNKVAADLADAIRTAPNNTLAFAEVPQTGVVVSRGPTLDGLGSYLIDHVPESTVEPVDVAQVLRQSGAQVLVNFLPVGSEVATRHYMEAALAANCAVVNCIPVFIASDPDWAARFTNAGLPIIGDDIKSQVGATIVHRVLTQLFRERGVELLRTYQLNFGGNTDFLNMLERERLKSKKVSKTRAVTSQLGKALDEGNVHVGPSDFVPWLEDRKWAHIRMEGRGCGGAPLNIELKLEVWDSPNSAGVVLDAIRCARIALDRGLAGPLEEPSSYYMKSPPVQHSDDRARALTESFMAG
jgi:myo-inositol-1-phosphate synthase